MDKKETINSLNDVFSNCFDGEKFFDMTSTLEVLYNMSTSSNTVGLRFFKFVENFKKVLNGEWNLELIIDLSRDYFLEKTKLPFINFAKELAVYTGKELTEEMILYIKLNG